MQDAIAVPLRTDRQQLWNVCVKSQYARIEIPEMASAMVKAAAPSIAYVLLHTPLLQHRALNINQHLYRKVDSAKTLTVKAAASLSPQLMPLPPAVAVPP